MAHNERGGRGVPRSRSLKGAPVSWGVSKALSKRTGKPAGCAKTGANLARNCAR